MLQKYYPCFYAAYSGEMRERAETPSVPDTFGVILRLARAWGVLARPPNALFPAPSAESLGVLYQILKLTSTILRGF